MKILINEGLSTLSNLTGIGNVSYNLWKHLNKITICDITNYKYLRIVPRLIRRQIYILITNLQNIVNNKYDIIHYLNYYTPRPFGKAKQVTTIHDMTAFLHPNTLPRLYLYYIKRAIIKSLNRNSAIIVPSNSIKNDLLSTFTFIDESMIHVCFNGVNENYFLKSSHFNNNLKNNNDNEPKYFLYVGTLERRKNIKFLIEAFLEASTKSAISEDLHLLLIGKLGFGNEDFINLLKHPRIKWLNYVSNDEIINFYKNSIALILPSIYEGFGITVAEAIILGVPVIASNIPTNIEFNNRHNKQLFLFDLNNKNQLLELLKYLSNNRDIRTKINYGNTSIYSYDTVAMEHFKIYQSLIS